MVVDYAVEATIQGVVQRQDGTPVPDARLTARLYDALCGIGDWSIWPLASSDSDGRFGETRLTFGSPFPACVVVLAEPPAMSGLKPDSVSGIYLTFDGAGSDTASVVLTLLPSDVP